MNHPLAQNAGLVLTSPMRRTIQTALGSVDWLLAKGIRLQADADWQGGSSWCVCVRSMPLLSVSSNLGSDAV